MDKENNLWAEYYETDRLESHPVVPALARAIRSYVREFSGQFLDPVILRLPGEDILVKFLDWREMRIMTVDLAADGFHPLRDCHPLTFDLRNCFSDDKFPKLVPFSAKYSALMGRGGALIIQRNGRYSERVVWLS
jgi:hypothetical protein